MSASIKICHLTSAHPDGDIRIFHKECASLAKAGFDVHLVIPNAESRIEKKVNIVSFESNYTSRKERMTKTVLQVYNEAVNLDADVYHFHDPELLRIALKLKRRGKKVIYDVHEDLPKQILSKFWINKYLRTLASVFFRSYENYIARKLSGIVCATPYIAERFALINPNTININNFPFVDELGSVARTSETPTSVCYIGGITAIRGLTELVNAMEHCPGVKLHLAGKASPENYLDQLKALPGWKNVLFHGLVDRKKVAEIMSDSFAGIVTFHPVPNHVDAQPNKMFEYMSAKLPVIGSHFELWKDIIEKNDSGICVDPLDSKAISDAINRLKNNPEEAQDKGNNGRNCVLEIYNWEREEEKLINFYKQLAR